jgi:hypothetical protein
MEINKELAKEIAVKHSKALVKEELTLVIMPAIKEAVSKSESKVDDMVWAVAEEAALKALEGL